jgi:hypothetical protein
MPQTAAQICTLACQEAKCPGYTAIAGQYMNMILVQHALQYDLDIVRRTTTITTAAGTPSYPLPANYLRSRECFYNLNGEIFYLSPKALEEYDQLFQGPGEIDYPYIFSTDIAQTTGPVIYFYPAPIAVLQVTLRYMDNNVEITSPQTSSVVPYLQDQAYLTDRVTECLMKITDDERLKLFMENTDEMDRRYMKMMNDQNDRAYKVKRDPDSFRVAERVRPTKLQGS